MISPKLQRFRFRDLLLYDLAGVVATIISACFFQLVIETYHHESRLLLSLVALPYPLIMLLFIRRRLDHLGITSSEFLGLRAKRNIAWRELLTVAVFTFTVGFSIRQVFAFFAGIEAQSPKFAYQPSSDILLLVILVWMLIIPLLITFTQLHGMVLLIRLSRRWDARAVALLLAVPSSLIGFSEGWVFSFFLYSVVMTLMYIRYETILAPIAAGSISGIVSIPLVMWAVLNHVEIYNLAFIAKYLWLFLAGAVVSLVPVLNFITRAWPPADWGKEAAAGRKRLAS